MVTAAAHEARNASRAVCEEKKEPAARPPAMALAVAAKWLSRYGRAPMSPARWVNAETEMDDSRRRLTP